MNEDLSPPHGPRRSAGLLFTSLRSKLIVFMALILFSTAGVVVFFTDRDVGREVLRIEAKNVENILDGVLLNIQGVYRGMIADRIASVELAKGLLRRDSENRLAALDLFSQPDASPEAARLTQVHFLEWLERLDMDAVGLFIASAADRVFFDSEQGLEGQYLKDLRDIKGQALNEMVNSPGASSAEFAVFSSSGRVEDGGVGVETQKLGYLTVFEPWQWTLGAYVDISHIEAREAVRLEQLTHRLEDQFSQVRIAESGSLFIFSREENLVVAPGALGHPDLLAPHFPDLIQSARERESRIITLNGKRMVTFTRFFRPLNWYVSALIPETEIRAPAQVLVQRQTMGIAIIFLLGVLAAVFFARRIARPLGVLAAETKELATQDLTSDAYDSRRIEELTRKNSDEVGVLASSFLFMQRELKRNVRNLVETTAAKERYQSELNVAREIQMSILPKVFPPFPEIRQFDLFALLEPAREIGGDLYDFFLLDDDHLCFTVGDVSDKGTPAALYMAITRTLIQSNAALESTPDRIMTLVNDALSRDNPKSMFVTLILGIMNIRTGRVRYANAGHNLPILVKRDGSCSYVQGISGPVAGAMEGLDYAELHLDLAPGDGLFIYTDGVTEAMNERLELFSDERLLHDVSREVSREIAQKTSPETSRETPRPSSDDFHAPAGTSAEALVRVVRTRVMEFVAGAPQSDDITMLMLTYQGDEERSARP
ncbi:SpoIIE family protein phosphatase [Desulfonatronum sp. SC1]|uniref:SpoIIE family protein phosphatase n=1 Tax=Desulfonatronum sp. SC1 TaxID=2109626 RepID=UPI000D306D02|nr:SpoIIE family protein phosphatase [Desulfonatronum sp. SC1]PTN39055.1 hypothetical protein C6366_01060 [Desulfonatronum sp. SC1]